MKKQLFIVILAICSASVLTSCSNDDNPTGQQGEYAGVPLIILDTDIGSSTDDLFALEMLYRYEDEGRCRLLGVMVDRVGSGLLCCLCCSYYLHLMLFYRVCTIFTSATTLAELANPHIIELFDGRFKHFRVIGQDASFEVSFLR